uniref:Uncharacterized protein n=1 Tax=Rhizophora mucronata TaxID=61149 RepID=A0A2P2PQJ2_RHIMU
MPRRSQKERSLCFSWHQNRPQTGPSRARLHSF